MNKNLFVCQINDFSLKIVKFARCNNQNELEDIYGENWDDTISEPVLIDKLKTAFKKLNYKNSPVIFSLSRSQATCKYTKIPATNIEEIEKIINLNSVRYLPYPAPELITAFEVISADNAGYSYVNQIIVHRDVMNRYLKILNAVKIKKIKVVLSSYGVSNLYFYLGQSAFEQVMLIDTEHNQSELTVIYNNKLYFSRAVKLSGDKISQKKIVTEEIAKTINNFVKETELLPPSKVMAIGELEYSKKLNISAGLREKIENTDFSFAGLIGLGLKEPSPTLILRSAQDKKKLAKIKYSNNILKIISYPVLIIFTLSLAVYKDLDNRKKYLKLLESEIFKLTKDVVALSGLEKRLSLLNGHHADNLTLVKVLIEVNQIIPDQVSLLSLDYDEDCSITLRGQTNELNQVFAFVSILQKSSIFKNLDINVKYASKEKEESRELVNFEINCAKRK